jgi:Tol biopolymer transport system component
MGEVYKALDPRLGREVAIKLLPAAFSSDSERVQRFALEARAASALNHPNILTIFDVGTEQGGAPYLVSELLEGQSLRELLAAQGRLPLRKATDIAVQVANGLAAAHQKGIVHRDLKPENLFVCDDGRVKILDFGLAKLTEKLRPTSGHQGATLSSATDPGTVLGSVGYMSPEQTRGLPADTRSDIFSFGAILYEMLTGQRAFVGDSAADISSAILKEDPPDVSERNPKVSPAMERIVQHCLEKEPGERFQSAKDLGFALRSISSGSEISTAAQSATVTGRRSQLLTFGIPLVLLALAAAAWLGHSFAKGHERQRVVRSQRLTDFVGLEEFPAVSPDGKSLAFISDTGGTRQIWIRLLSGGVPLQITHDAVDHLYPRWSRDSSSIIYYTPPAAGTPQGKIWEISSLGGFPRQIADSISGADVDHGGSRLTFFQLEESKVKLVSTARDGSDARSVFESAFNSEQPSFGYSFPRWSPDDKWIAYQHATAMWADDIYLVASAGGKPRPITNEAKLMGGLAWTADGSIVYSSAQGNTVLYLPSLQLWTVKPDGGPARQLTYEDVVYEYPDVAGSKIIASRRRMQFDLWKFPVGADPVQNVAQGTRLSEQSGGIFAPSVSPDDSEIAFLSDSGGHGNIWVKNLKNGDLRQITFEQDPHNTIGTPVWSPVNQEIAFASTHKQENWATVGYSVVNSDGSNLHTVIQTGAWASWSGDGKYFYYSEALPTIASQSNRLMKIASTGGAPTVVSKENASGPAPAFDGSGIYYVVALENLNGGLDFELRAARPENAPARMLARISSTRAPQWQGLHPTLSHDNRWLALPLNDKYGTNIWLISTSDGSFRQVTDFGKQRTFIVRRVSWSSDNKFIFAAVGVGQEDIVLLDGMLDTSDRSNQ